MCHWRFVVLTTCVIVSSLPIIHGQLSSVDMASRCHLHTNCSKDSNTGPQYITNSTSVCEVQINSVVVAELSNQTSDGVECNCTNEKCKHVSPNEGTIKLKQIGKLKRQETLLLYAITAMVSSLFLILVILAHLFLFQMTHHSRILLCHSGCLLVMNVTLTIRIFVEYSNTMAINIVIFAIQYTSVLAAFFWLSVLAFDLWKTFLKFRGNWSLNANGMAYKKRWFIYMCAYAWGIPMLLCTTLVGISLCPTAQQRLHIEQTFAKTNWFQNDRIIFVFFYGPIIIILVENSVFFLLTILNLKKANHGSDILNHRKGTKLLTVYMKLFFIMGFCWITEIITWQLGVFKVKADEAAWYLPNMINLSQGLFLFLIHVCKKKTIRLIETKFCRKTRKQTITFLPNNHRKKNSNVTVATISTQMARAESWPKSIHNN